MNLNRKTYSDVAQHLLNLANKWSERYKTPVNWDLVKERAVLKLQKDQVEYTDRFLDLSPVELALVLGQVNSICSAPASTNPIGRKFDDKKQTDTIIVKAATKRRKKVKKN